MYSGTFCGCKAADYLATVSDSLCFILSSADLSQALSSHDQFFRRVLRKINMKTISDPKTNIQFIIKLDETAAVDDKLVMDNVSNFMKSLWTDIDEEVTLFNLRIFNSIISILTFISHFRKRMLTILSMLL